MKYCFFSPSYRGDLDRIVILRKSINAFCKERPRHYIVVPKEDFSAFRRALAGDDAVILLKQNDYIERYFYPNAVYRAVEKLLPSQVWRAKKYAGRSGWILQQITKFNIPNILIDEEAALILDSDLFFIKPFSVSDLFGQTDTVKTLVEIRPTCESAMHRMHIEKAREILRLPEGDTSFHFMSWPFFFYKSWGESLLKYIEDKHQKPWQRVLFEAEWFSEYSIYGIYVEEILKPADIRLSTSPIYQGIWSQQDFENFIAGNMALDPSVVCIVVQSNLSISPEEYGNRLDDFIRHQT